MRSIDHLFEKSARSLARHTSRRSLLAALGKVLTGAALIPLLPIDRSFRAQAAEPAAGTGRRNHSAGSGAPPANAAGSAAPIACRSCA